MFHPDPISPDPTVDESDHYDVCLTASYRTVRDQAYRTNWHKQHQYAVSRSKTLTGYHCLDLSLYAYPFLLASFYFSPTVQLLVPCGRLSWLKRTLKYRLISYRILLTLQ